MKNTFLSPPPILSASRARSRGTWFACELLFWPGAWPAAGAEPAAPPPHLVNRVYRSPAAPRFWGCRTPAPQRSRGTEVQHCGCSPRNACPPARAAGETSQTCPEVLPLGPPPWAGEGGRSAIPAAPPARSPAICTAFVGFFNAANVYHLPNRLDRFCFLSRGGCEPPRLPRSRLPHRHGLIWYSARRPPHLCMQDKVF